MKRFVLFSLIAVALVAALLVAQQKRRKTVAYVLSRYPQTPTLQGYLKQSASNKNIVFSEATFDKTLNSVTACTITKDATRTCGPGAAALWGSWREWQLKPAQLDAIRDVTRAMPPTIIVPAPENLILIGFWQNGRWTTQIYDESRLPWQMKRIHQIIKAR